MKNKKGFALIEILAVIIILGVLMVISVPSVTQYMLSSRKQAIISSSKIYIDAAIAKVNDLQFEFFEENVIYAIPIECIALEKGGVIL